MSRRNITCIIDKRNAYYLMSYIGLAQDVENSSCEFQERYVKVKQELLEMGFELQQIDDAVLSSQSLQGEKLLQKLTSSGN